MTDQFHDNNNPREESGTTGTVYYRPHSLLLLAHSLFIGLEDKTLNRKSFRLILSGSGNFKLTIANQEVLHTKAVLLSPTIGAFEISALEEDVALFDFTIRSPEYPGLKRLLQNSDRLLPEAESFHRLQDLLKEGQRGSLTTDDVKWLMSQAYQALTGQEPAPLAYDPRVADTINRIESLPLADISLVALANAVHLSPDRLRKLFKQQTGSTFSQYARASALWRAMKLLDQQVSATEIAHQIGFHDAAHFYHAFTDQFGISLSDKLNQRKFHRVRCDN